MRIVLIACSLFLTFVVTAQSIAVESVTREPTSETTLWLSTVSPYLVKDLWKKGSAYDAGHRLMVPLYAACTTGHEDWQKEFTAHFERFSHSLDQLDSVLLNRFQYLYIVTEAMVLSRTKGDNQMIPQNIPEWVFQDVKYTWESRIIPHWSHQPFKGMKASVEWKLAQRKVDKTYYRAINDDELYLFALAADLKYYSRNLPASSAKRWDEVLNPILTTAEKVCRQEGVILSDGGWCFQPGVWTDHPDFSYAGNFELGPNLKPRKIAGIGWDTSHGHRFPLWLSSLARAFPEGSASRTFFLDIRSRLAAQFFGKVLVPPSTELACYRTRNFMDGSNGIYRYGYPTLGNGNGYAPYQTSGAILLGWWTFLSTPRAKALYKALWEQGLLSSKCLTLYAGPQREQAKVPITLLNSDSEIIRFYRLIAKLAQETPDPALLGH
jgi:hypothetical protein